MLGPEDVITSLTLYEVKDVKLSAKIKLGAYWDIIKHLSKLEDDRECYENLTSAFEKLDSDNKLVFAVSCLNVFLQNNFTGPIFSTDLLSHITIEDLQLTKENSTVNCQMYHLTKAVKLFNLAKNHFNSSNSTNLTDLIFQFRCNFVNQLLLDELATEIFEEIEKSVQEIEEHEQFTSLGKEEKCKILIEIAFMYLHYEVFTKSRNYMDTAKSLIGFDFHLTGIPGKRTKYQIDAVAQLTVETVIEGLVNDKAPLENEPQQIDMNDDTLLEKISFSDPSVQNNINNLTAPFLLHSATLKLKDNILEDMLKEEVIAFIEAIIEGTTFSYCIGTHAYFIRSKLEKSSIRKLCRSLEQLEEVVQGFTCQKTCSRTGGLLLSGLPPMWVQQKLLAETYTSIGSYKSALDIYEALQLRDAQVTSLIAAGRYEAGEKLVRELLREGETPKLYCLLGDCTQDIQYYTTAWELSGGSSSRAMKLLGYHYFNIKQYGTALECMLKSLDCNYLQGGLWFTAGCTALAIPEFETAIRCFKQAVHVDDESCQAWSNLGAVYERTGEMMKAYNCFKEATRYAYNNWRVWDNYVGAAARIRHFSSIIHGYRELINMGQKYCDKKIINCLVAAVRDNMESATGEQGAAYYDRVVVLFDYVSTKVTSSFDLWKAKAVLHLDVEGKEDVSKGVDYLIKAYHSAALLIEKSLQEFLKCAECSQVLYKHVIVEPKESPTYAQHLESLRSILQILITKGSNLSGKLDPSDGDAAKEAITEYVGKAREHLGDVEEAQLYV